MNQPHPEDEAAESHEISLDDLSRAFANMMDASAGEFLPESLDDPADGDDELEQPEAVEDPHPVTPAGIIEAILFVGHPENRPLSNSEMSELMRGVTSDEVDEVIQQLNQEYERIGHPYTIASVGGGYQLQLRPQFSRLRDQFYGRVKEARLNQAAVDVLAIVAYQQGISRPEIDKIRGKPSGGMLANLVRRDLLSIERDPKQPRIPRYHTTPRFLRLFGLDDLNDLPHSHEMDMQ